MIKLVGRMIPTFLRARRGPAIDVSAGLVSYFRVLPHDIDINGHLNNGRYLQLFDLNRAEWLMRTGVWSVIRREGWRPVLGSTAIQFRRELKLWDVGLMETRLLGWDDRWTYLEHRMSTRDNRPVALALAKAGFRKAGRWIRPETLAGQLPFPLPTLELPEHARRWQQLDGAVAERLLPQRSAAAQN